MYDERKIICPVEKSKHKGREIGTASVGPTRQTLCPVNRQVVLKLGPDGTFNQLVDEQGSGCTNCLVEMIGTATAGSSMFFARMSAARRQQG